MKTSPPEHSCIWPQAQPRCRPCRAWARAQSLSDAGRCASSFLFPAGQATDTPPRASSHSPLSERLGQGFVIENRTGAGGQYRHRGGPCTRLRTATRSYRTAYRARSTRRFTRNSNFDLIRDSRPGRQHRRRPLCDVDQPLGFPAKTVPEFIAYAKANPGKLKHGIVGALGSVSHVFGELFQNDDRYRVGSRFRIAVATLPTCSADRTQGRVRHHSREHDS